MGMMRANRTMVPPQLAQEPEVDSRGRPAIRQWDIPSARPRPTSWPHTRLSPEDLSERVLTVSEDYHHDRKQFARLRRATPKVLEWFTQWPGETWQERWLASGLEDKESDWMEDFLAWREARGEWVSYDEQEARSAMCWLMQAQAFHPSLEWILRQRFNYVLSRVPATFDRDGRARLVAHLDATGRTAPRTRSRVMKTIGRLMLCKGGLISDITIGDCLEYIEVYDRVLPANGGRYDRAFYTVLFELGTFGEHAPDRLRALTVKGQLTVPQMVDYYDIKCRPIRDLLVDYLTVRSVDLDYSTLRRLAQVLCQLFWKDLEEHHPGISSLKLSQDAATAWKERLGTIRHSPGRIGKQRLQVQPILLLVRAFYIDLAQWAVHEPARWGPWATPSPIPSSATQVAKERKRAVARMHQRTRTRAPLLPELVTAVERWRRESKDLFDRASAVEFGEGVDLGGELWLRHAGRQSDRQRIVVLRPETGEQRDLTFEDERSFWAWASVETLRHTGMRIEEVLELTHYSFIAYTLPSTGEVVPMLQVTPSKADRERLLLVSPELGEVLTAVIQRVREGRDAIPLISRYDQHEGLHSPRLPFLFQRRRGFIPTAIPPAFIASVLREALERAGLTDQTGATLDLTPHDFRRIFATDALQAGLPPHITAKILGHEDVNTTMGYAAIYPEDVISHHRAYIARRRQLRPSEEYRDLTPEEWDEFITHFELRKVALGVCTRDYGTPCVHEHACFSELASAVSGDVRPGDDPA
ncbi:tyrosine-type recombinase/integrase [Streptomyces sp. 3214.6]|uniref:tyrosine-type recombinase/integrase n=1 Tax=Streptomyces sp. 3214.6 TaxID=1882757 RepID=UPI00090AA0D9|nr:site-specific integrase [Streptomyces sp. 3214.6]SHH32316.1 Phage integrase family protein [Streptomyces sp. 3214.6]